MHCVPPCVSPCGFELRIVCFCARLSLHCVLAYDVTTIRAATPMYLMSRKIKCLGVKMVLSGEGSDEMFGGYLYFHKCPNAAELQKECVRKLKGLYKYVA